jgi:transcriptional regulator with XRE-family HTH domain
MELIPVDPFKRRFKELEERENLTLAEVAGRLGWLSKKGVPDTTRIARMLGLTPEQGTFRSNISYDNACKLCRALHIDYVDVGV